MNNKNKQINIFESSFDSFEFDDGFLMKVDSELKKNEANEERLALLNQCNSKKRDQHGKKEKVSDSKANFYDLPLFVEDLNESDFFDFTKGKCKKFSSKVVSSQNGEKEKKGLNVFTTCLSPIQGPKTSNKLSLSSSTPLKENNSLPTDNQPSTSQKVEKTAKNSEFDYFEADLFEDWDVDDINKKDPPKDTVTFSQALKLIEEAELERQNQECLNQSVDLLTGEVVGADVGSMFDEPFELPKSAEEKCDKESSNSSVVLEEEFRVGCKPAAAHKLNFGSEKINSFKLTNNKEFNYINEFDSDDDFDFLTQELLKKPKTVSNYAKPATSNVMQNKNITPLKGCDLNDSTDDIIILNNKRGKQFKIIESDGTEDSPSPKVCRRNKTKKWKNFEKNFCREFIDSEAEVSDKIEVSSDEAEEEGEYDKSFLDEESYFSQNCSANMTAKYLESVKTVRHHGNFKIPAAKPYNPRDVFSQVLEESNTDYEIDSFCVPNDVEEEMKTDLSDLEVAEKILEMDRIKRKKKRTQKFRK